MVCFYSCGRAMAKATKPAITKRAVPVSGTVSGARPAILATATPSIMEAPVSRCDDSK
jgi:hypothetical protein